MKNYTGNSYDDYDSSEPIGYRHSLASANDDVERLNKENQLLIVKQKNALLCLEQWERENPNPALFHPNGIRKTVKEMKQPVNSVLFLDWRNRNRVEKDKYSDVLYSPFEQLSYEVMPLDELKL